LKVLVTGGTGFVGRKLVGRLDSLDVELVLPVREQSRQGLPVLRAGHEVLHTEDLFAETPARLLEMCSGVDVVVHGAWSLEPGQYLESPNNFDCLEGTVRLGEAAALAGVSRFVGIGTCFEYEMDTRPIETGSRLLPLNSYAATKALSFLLLRDIFSQTATEFAWCRLFYLLGEGEDPMRLGEFVRSRLAAGKSCSLSHGNQVRDYMDVADAAESIAKVATGRQVGEINICSGVGRSVRQIVESIADEFERRDLLLFGDREESGFDPPYLVGVPTRL
jgi:dTDP-6-deoxy-L-talose 4-dehydrogenase (NAD+)